MKNIVLGSRVVRSKGDYVVGRVGSVVAIDDVKMRGQVQWDKDVKTWVSFSALELENIPYKIIIVEVGIDKIPRPKYIKL